MAVLYGLTKVLQDVVAELIAGAMGREGAQQPIQKRKIFGALPDIRPEPKVGQHQQKPLKKGI